MRRGKTAPKMMSVGLHCRLIGRPARFAGLISFLDHIAAHDHIWVAGAPISPGTGSLPIRIRPWRGCWMTSPFLTIEPLTRSTFAPFGTVIETEGATRLPINQGTTTRFDALATVDVAARGGNPCLAVSWHPPPRSDRHPPARTPPVWLAGLLSLVDAEWLVVVATGNADDTAPDFTSLRCFLASGTQGVSYARGTWHHPLLVLLPEQDFLVVDRAAPADEAAGQNLDEVWFDGPGGIAALIPEKNNEISY